MITIGSGIGLMGFSVYFADCVLLNVTRNKKKVYRLKESQASLAVLTEKEIKNIKAMDTPTFKKHSKYCQYKYILKH